MLRTEYLAWKKCPSMEMAAHPFLARIYSEDVRPCLQFPAQALGKAGTDAIHSNTLCLSPVKVRPVTSDMETTPPFVQNFWREPALHF